MTTIHHRPVFSSNVSTIGYDDASGELHVAYRNGKKAVFEGVPPDTARNVLSSPSIGGALHQFIRGRFKHRYVEG